MYPIKTLVFAAILAIAAAPAAWAQTDAAAAEAMAEAEEESDEVIAEDAIIDEEDAIPGLVTYDGTEVDLDEFLWLKRPIVLFANTPNDPALIQQLRYIEERADEFVKRDVVVVVDTDPAANTEVRQRLRPRGFMMAIIDKDGEVKQRRPAPRTGREIMAVIDRFPLRRQELMDQLPSGRD